MASTVPDLDGCAAKTELQDPSALQVELHLPGKVIQSAPGSACVGGQNSEDYAFEIFSDHSDFFTNHQASIATLLSSTLFEDNSIEGLPFQISEEISELEGPNGQRYQANKETVFPLTPSDENARILLEEVGEFEREAAQTVKERLTSNMRSNENASEGGIVEILKEANELESPRGQEAKPSNEEKEMNELERRKVSKVKINGEKKPTDVERKSGKGNRAGTTKKANTIEIDLETNPPLGIVVRRSARLRMPLRELQATATNNNALENNKERTTRNKLRSLTSVAVNTQLPTDPQHEGRTTSTADNVRRRSRRISLPSNCNICNEAKNNELARKKSSTQNRRRSEGTLKSTDSQLEHVTEKRDTKIANKELCRSGPNGHKPQADRGILVPVTPSEENASNVLTYGLECEGPQVTGEESNEVKRRADVHKKSGLSNPEILEETSELERPNDQEAKPSKEKKDVNKLEGRNDNKPTVAERNSVAETRPCMAKKSNTIEIEKQNATPAVRRSARLRRPLRDLQATATDNNGLQDNNKRNPRSKQPVNAQLLTHTQPDSRTTPAAENKSTRSRRVSLPSNCNICNEDTNNELARKKSSTKTRRRSEGTLKPTDKQLEHVAEKSDTKTANKELCSSEGGELTTMSATSIAGKRRSRSVGPLTKKTSANRSPEVDRRIFLTPNANSSFTTKRLRRVNFGDELKKFTTKSAIKVMTTIIDTTRIKKLTDKSAGLCVMTENAMDADVLVMEQGIRTFKFLMAIARGLPIVTTSWLTVVNEQKALVDSTPYILRNVEFESKYQFSIENAVKWASQHKIFEGFTFMMTRNIQPEPEQMKALISCAGGKVQTQIAAAFQTKVGTAYLVSTFADRHYWRKYLDANRFIQIIHSEGVIEAILRQRASKLNKFIIHD